MADLVEHEAELFKDGTGVEFPEVRATVEKLGARVHFRVRNQW